MVPPKVLFFVVGQSVHTAPVSWRGAGRHGTEQRGAALRRAAQARSRDAPRCAARRREARRGARAMRVLFEQRNTKGACIHSRIDASRMGM